MNTPNVGGLCQSLNGRDAGRFFIIKELSDNDSVIICDGNYRKISKPKKKKIKHLRLYPVIFEGIEKKFTEGKQVFDSEIYSALKQYNQNAEINADKSQQINGSKPTNL
jgi:ribosomal protein L14E/L6E/L27E